jgi:hypothetical protein
LLITSPFTTATIRTPDSGVLAAGAAWPACGCTVAASPTGGAATTSAATKDISFRRPVHPHPIDAHPIDAHLIDAHLIDDDPIDSGKRGGMVGMT